MTLDPICWFLFGLSALLSLGFAVALILLQFEQIERKDAEATLEAYRDDPMQEEPYHPPRH